MSVAVGALDGSLRRRSPLNRLWVRTLEGYPAEPMRIAQLVLVVAITICLYWQLYETGAVATTVLRHYGMGFSYYLYGTGVFAAIAGAFFALIGGWGDKFGRANFVTYGLAIACILILFLPTMPSEFWYIFLYACVGCVEGIILVNTPALVRDFTPQRGRGFAMGFWTIGPVGGSLIADLVTSLTLPHLKPWEDQFNIAGITGLCVFAIALVGLRQLSPGVRDQRMVTLRERALVELRARGIDVNAAVSRNWRKMVQWDLAVPSAGITLFLLIYIFFVANLVIYLAVQFGWSTAQADSLGKIFWGFNCGALILVGLVSDLLKVRKPIILFGAVGSAALTIVFLSRIGHPTSFLDFAIICSFLASFLGITFGPWFAAYTETAERRNPALLATALAVNGYLQRGIGVLATIALIGVVSSVTPIVTYGAQVGALAAKYKPELATAAAVPKPVLASLSKNPTTSSALKTAIGDISSNLHVTSTTAIADLTALGAAAKTATFKYLEAHGPTVATALRENRSQWEHWFWVCVGGIIVFIPTIWLLAGRWGVGAAKRDFEEHEQRVDEELRRAGLAAPTGAALAGATVSAAVAQERPGPLTST